MKPSNERERQQQQEASARVAAKAAASREDRTLKERLDQSEGMRHTSNELVTRYTGAIGEALGVLPPDHPASQILRDALNPDQ